MTSFGLICAGTSSEEFTRTLCQTCYEFQAQDKLLFVGVHPSGDNAKQVVATLKGLGIKAETVERRDVAETADIYALTALFNTFNGITVPVPDLVVLVLDEKFIEDPDLIALSWKAIDEFKGTYPRVEVIAVYFTRKNRYTSALDQIKARLRAKNGASRWPLAHALLISDRASLGKRFATQYRHILARHLAILLVSETSTTLRKQIQPITTPFVGMALDEVSTSRLWERMIALPGKSPTHAVDEISGALVTAVVNLLNRPDPQTSFDEIGPETRKNGDDMLAITIFTPPIPKDDRNKLESAIKTKLATYAVDAQGLVVPQPQPPNPMVPQPQPPVPGLQSFSVISCDTAPLVKANAIRERVPVINRLPLLQKRGEKCQILVFFGIEESHLS